ncbi:MAG: hypothetical protein WCI67_19425 [Chloroflexales bacterium]
MSRISPIFLTALAISAALGLAGGSAFHWAAPQRAWEIFTAAFLWTLIAAAGTTIGRFYGERVRRGNWRHGLWLAAAQTFPLTTVFLLAAATVAAFAGSWIAIEAAPICYASTFAVAFVTGPLSVITSPFIK